MKKLGPVVGMTYRPKFGRAQPRTVVSVTDGVNIGSITYETPFPIGSGRMKRLNVLRSSWDNWIVKRIVEEDE